MFKKISLFIITAFLSFNSLASDGVIYFEGKIGVDACFVENLNVNCYNQNKGEYDVQKLEKTKFPKEIGKSSFLTSNNRNIVHVEKIKSDFEIDSYLLDVYYK